MLQTIIWDFPNHIPLFGFELRFYSLMFIISFVLGSYGMTYIFKKENVNPKLLDSLTYFTIGATIIGARLGHVFFYEWADYKDNLIEIFKVWKGGLASHGAAVAIVAALWYWSVKRGAKHPLWTLDRIVIVVALAAGFIRLGNWFNSEIYGAPANSDHQTVFVQAGEDLLMAYFGEVVDEITFEHTGEVYPTDTLDFPLIQAEFALMNITRAEAENELGVRIANALLLQDPGDQNLLIPSNFDFEVIETGNGLVGKTTFIGVPRYPTQLYESAAYFLVFIILALLYLKTNWSVQSGRLLGTFLVLVFGFRFFIENLKEVQVAQEVSMTLNLGQKLSIPLVAIGLLLLFTSKPRK